MADERNLQKQRTADLRVTKLELVGIKGMLLKYIGVSGKGKSRDGLLD